MSLIETMAKVLKESRTERIKMAIAILATTMTSAVSIITAYQERRLKEENQVYEVQMQKLTQVQENIDNLSQFIIQQKVQLKQSQQAVESLKKEQESLKPAVEADRQVIESILRFQAERASSNLWQERIIGFGLGVASSLIASLIWAGFKRGRGD